jgi:hypothetical protein
MRTWVALTLATIISLAWGGLAGYLNGTPAPPKPHLPRWLRELPWVAGQDGATAMQGTLMEALVRLEDFKQGSLVVCK